MGGASLGHVASLRSRDTAVTLGWHRAAEADVVAVAMAEGDASFLATAVSLIDIALINAVLSANQALYIDFIDVSFDGQLCIR